MRNLLGVSAVLALCLTSPLSGTAADPPPLRTLDSHFPFSPPESLEAWQERAEQVRRQIRVACGVWPMPELSQEAPWIGEERVFAAEGDVPGYSVTPITFESLPGLAVTGSLYRPHPPREQPGPAILCPHGHWPEGRFHDAGEGAARREIAQGAERFLSAARSPMQARSVQLARMGCTVLLYDMLGYADSQQISFDRAHRYARQSDEENRPDDDGWLLFSPLAESHLQSAMGLQTIGTLRAIDVITALPNVDADRVAITGASGGGTQTFIAAAIDPRIAAAFPAVMVSTGMQGGCTCENACLLRDGTGNIEIAALFAPRPQGLTAANDWTRTMPEDGFPELKQLYGLWGAADAVELFPALHFDHNYNHVARAAMYTWLNRIFNLGLDSPVLEADFQRLESADLTVWSESHPQPEGGLRFERQLLRRWAEATAQSMAAAVHAAEEDGGEQFDELITAGWRTVIGPPPENVALVEDSVAETEDRQGRRGSARVRFDDSREVTLQGRHSEGTPRGVLLVAHPRGPGRLDASDETEGDKAAGDEADRAGVAAALEAGWAVVFAELEGAGEESQPLVRDDRLAAAYTYGYNPPRVVRQARQLVAAAEGLEQLAQRLDAEGTGSELPIRLVGCGDLAPAAAVARALAPDRFEACVLQTGGFRFADVPSIDHAHFLPGAARYLDLPGLLALASDGSLTVTGESPESLVVTTRLSQARRASGRPQEPAPRIVEGADEETLWREAIRDEADR